MRKWLCLLFAFACLCKSAFGQRTVVIPAVSDNTAGVNNSVWVTEVQIIKMDPRDQLTVRRVWVCVQQGGFLEDPASALRWNLAERNARGRILTLLGRDLLAGSDATLGAVALEITGGEAIVNARVADIYRGTVDGKTPFGQGQRVPTQLSALQGESHIPWLGGCRNYPCNETPPLYWEYFRNNVGLVNPNPEPLTITGTAIPFGYDAGEDPGELGLLEPNETFVKTIPPFGWAQFAWSASQEYGFSQWEGPRVAYAGFVMNLSPASDAQYFAYVSTVFAPDPASDVPAFNDPMFIPAEPGGVEPYKPD